MEQNIRKDTRTTLSSIVFMTSLLLTLGTSWASDISLSDYYPIDPWKHGIKTFEWTFGQSGRYTSEVRGIETVPYLSGPLSGVYITNSFFMPDDALTYNDGQCVKLLGSRGLYASADEFLTDHPSAASFGTMRDGLIIKDGVFYLLTKDLAHSEMVRSSRHLIDIQDVTTLSGTYQGSLIMWILDTDFSFSTLDFHGKQSHLGIQLPTSHDTGGHSVAAIEIYGFKTGLIAYGDIDAATGSLNDLCELKEIAPYLAHEGVTGTRDLPGCYRAGETVSVTLDLEVDEDHLPDTVTVEDYVPPGWSVVAATPAYDSWDAAVGKVTWVFQGGQVSDSGMDIEYEVTVPSAEAGTRMFLGQLLYNDPSTGDPVEEFIGGDTETHQCHPVAKDGDCATDDFDSWETIEIDGGRLRFHRGLVEYSTSNPPDPSGQPACLYWTKNAFGRAHDWEASIEAFVPALNISGTDMGVDLRAYWPDVRLAGRKVNAVGIRFDRRIDNESYVSGSKDTGRIQREYGLTPVDSANVSLRINWESSSERFSVYYDPNGGKNDWDLVDHIYVDDWAMEEDELFYVGAGAWAGSMTVDWSDGIAFDDFEVSVGTCCADTLPGDVNSDCKVDFRDFVIMASHWLECGLEVSEACR